MMKIPQLLVRNSKFIGIGIGIACKILITDKMLTGIRIIVLILLFESTHKCVQIGAIEEELNCLFPEHQLPCCDVIAIQIGKQPMNGALGAGHKFEESDWSVVGKCC